MAKTTTEPAKVDLRAQLVSLKQDLLEAVKTHRAGELPNPAVIRTTRRAIARTLTAINAEAAAAKSVARKEKKDA